jgi:hypothetical protein
MDLGIVITLIVALVVGVAVLLFAITKTHHRLETKLKAPKKDKDGH